MADLTYAHTPKPFGREVTFALKGRELIVSDERTTLTAPVREIVQMRLTYEPKNSMAKGFRMKLWFSNNRTAVMTNLAWRSLIQVERQDEAYRRFVTALVAEIGRANPACRFLAGHPRPAWIVTSLASLATLGGIGWLAYRSLQIGAGGMALITLLFAAWFAFTIGEMIRRNRPQSFTPDRIPPDVLP